MSWSILEIARPWDSLDGVPMHLRGQVKRAQDARMYGDLDIPRVGDTVAATWDRDRPGVVTRVNLPGVYFTLPDGTEHSTGIRGMVLVSRKPSN